MPAAPLPKSLDTLDIDLQGAIDDYLKREKTADVRHEFYYGEITEMPGGTYEHGAIEIDFLITLAFLLRAVQSLCELHGSDQSIFIDPGVFYYPDLSVTCDPPQIDFENALRNPVLVVEVLSKSTETRDRGEKKREYQRIASLQHYVLLEQNAPRIEHYERDAVSGLWPENPAIMEGINADLPLLALGVSVPLADIYRRASFDDK